MVVIDKAIDLQIGSDGQPQRLHPGNVSIDQRLDYTNKAIVLIYFCHRLK